MFILLGDWQYAHSCICKVILDKNMLAKRRISILKIGENESFIDHLFKFFNGYVEYCPLITSGGLMFLELTKAEWIDYEIFGRHDFSAAAAAMDLMRCDFV